MERLRERLASQVEREVDILLQREPGRDQSSRMRLLLSLSQGVRTVFDQRTHRQLRQVHTRFSYIYLAARLLEGRGPEEVADAVLEHLEQAEKALQIAWGQREYDRQSQSAARLADFGAAAEVLGAERLAEPVASLGEQDRESLIQAVGSYYLNEVSVAFCPHHGLGLTTPSGSLASPPGLEICTICGTIQGQGLRLFQQLLVDVRAAVIGRVFAYQPRRIEITPTEVAESPTAAGAAPTGGGKKKRRRH
jgi:hypothetical protein